MADPFEVRIRFTSQLQHLNASVSSAQKAAQYALKNRDMDEDLHSCILEQLEKSNLNVRANIMYFLEHLCDMSQRDSHPEFIKMMRRDIFAIVDAVAPADQGGAANVKVVRKVLGGLQQKRYLDVETVDELEASLKDRAGAGADEDEDITMLESPPRTSTTTRTTATKSTATATAGDGAATGADTEGDGTTVATATTTVATGTATGSASGRPVAKGGGEGANGPLKLGEQGRPDKRQIEQRIEEDRERHKRLKEGIWEVSGADDDEFNQTWDEASEVGDDDYARAEEEAEERLRCFEQERSEARETGKL